MFTIVREAEAITRQIASNKRATNFITKDINPEFSLATIEATDYSEKETTEYNRAYYVLEGVMELKFKSEIAKLQKGDSCFIAKGTTYEMYGSFKAIVVNQPAFGATKS